jgi:hypothetical protein
MECYGSWLQVLTQSRSTGRSREGSWKNQFEFAQGDFVGLMQQAFKEEIVA